MKNVSILGQESASQGLLDNLAVIKAVSNPPNSNWKTINNVRNTLAT